MKNFKTVLIVSLVATAFLGAGAIHVAMAESPSQIQAAKLSLAEAKKIALEEAKSGKVVSVDLEGKKNGSLYYEVTILDNSSEKEYKIDAQTGNILKTESETIDDQEDRELAQAQPKVSFEEAEKILLQKYPQAKIYDEDLDIKAGQLVYKLKALNDNQKVKLRIDANSGSIIHEAVK